MAEFRGTLSLGASAAWLHHKLSDRRTCPIYTCTSAWSWRGSFNRRFRQPVTKDVRAESLRHCRTSSQHRQYLGMGKKVEPFSEASFGLRLIGPPDAAKPALIAMEKRVGD